MTLLIILKETEISLKLLKNRQVIDIEAAKYYHNLSDMLISSLDKLLKRNRLDPIRLFSNNEARHGAQAKSNGAGLEAVKSYKILGDLGDNSTSYKIASAFVEALKSNN